MKRSTLTLLLTGLFGASAFATAAFAEGDDGRAPPRMEHHGKMQDHLKEMDADGDGKVSETEMTAYRSAKFKQADADGDGTLTQTELVSFHQAEMQRRREERQAKMFAAIDKDGSGGASLEEFLTAGPHSFDRMDRDDDGFIDASDFGRRYGEGKPRQNK